MNFRNSVVVAASAIALTTASSAMAADFAEPVPVSTWTGFYIGGGGGYGSAVYDESIDYIAGDPLLQINPFDEGSKSTGAVYGFDLLGIGGNLDFGGEGGLGTIHGGFDFQFGESFVIGILGSYDFSNIKTNAGIHGHVCYELTYVDDSCDTGEIDGQVGLNYTLKAEDTWSILGKFGYLINPDVLAYGLIGYSETSMKGKLTWDGGLLPLVGGTETLSSYGFTLKGLTVGGGLQAKITDNVRAGIQYRYIDYDSLTRTYGPDDELVFKTNASQQTVRATVEYYFNPFGM